MSYLVRVSRTYQKLIYSNFSGIRGTTRVKDVLRKLLSRYSSFQVIEVDGVPIFGNTDIYQFSELFTFGYSEELDYMRYLASNLSEDDVFLDVGANYGLWSSYMDNYVSSVISVEPNPKGRAYLYFNRNYFDREYKIDSFALSDDNGEGEIYLSSSSLGHGSLEADTYDNKVQIEKKRADEVYEEVDAIKIDVEGAEGRVIEGGKRLLDDVDLVVLELHEEEQLQKFNTSKKSVTKSLRDKDFELYVMTNGNLSEFEIEKGNQKLIAKKKDI